MIAAVENRVNAIRIAPELYSGTAEIFTDRLDAVSTAKGFFCHPACERVGDALQIRAERFDGDGNAEFVSEQGRRISMGINPVGGNRVGGVGENVRPQGPIAKVTVQSPRYPRNRREAEKFDGDVGKGVAILRRMMRPTQPLPGWRGTVDAIDAERYLTLESFRLLVDKRSAMPFFFTWEAE